MGVTHNLILGGGASLPTTLNVTVSGGTATTVTASLGSRSVSLAYDSTSALWTATLPKNATGNWTVTATDGSKTVSDLIAISGPGIWSIELKLGNVPSGYTELEYIESTGTQYIDTGLIASQLLNVEMGLTIVGSAAYEQMMGAAVGDPGSAWLNTTEIRWGGSANKSSGLTRGVYADIKVENGVYSNGITVQTFTTSFSTSPYTIFLFARNAYYGIDGGLGRIYYCHFYNSDGDLRNFVPARRDSDSVLGMYDLVTQTFYTNAGSGTFIAGPDV